jgi:hypothetical protein
MALAAAPASGEPAWEGGGGVGVGVLEVAVGVAGVVGVVGDDGVVGVVAGVVPEACTTIVPVMSG